MDTLLENSCTPALRQDYIISITFYTITSSGIERYILTVQSLTNTFCPVTQCFRMLSDVSVSGMFCSWIKAMQYVLPNFLVFVWSWCIKSPWWCFHLVVAVGLVWSNDCKSIASDSIATGRVSQTRHSQVRFQQRQTLWPSWLGVGH